MVEYVRLNGTAVRVSSFGLAAGTGPGGTAVHEASLVVVLRGAPTDRAFRALLAERPLRLDVADGPSFDVTVTHAAQTVVGSGPTAAYRHEMTLREMPSS